jgi:hypothetical protein
MALKFKQLVTGEWEGGPGGTLRHSLYGLAEDGSVYRWSSTDASWQRLPDRVGQDLTPWRERDRTEHRINSSSGKSSPF